MHGQTIAIKHPAPKAKQLIDFLLSCNNNTVWAITNNAKRQVAISQCCCGDGPFWKGRSSAMVAIGTAAVVISVAVTISNVILASAWALQPKKNFELLVSTKSPMQQYLPVAAVLRS
ncbi:hypothetical protein D918_02080 [Trichuris suis]|nr:hypothetical protein D918_02080 [Trichuris suis]